MMSSSNATTFDPSRDIPSLAGKTILVTGANSGIGKQASLEFAKRGPARVWMAARSLEKLESAVNDIRSEVTDAPVKPLELDLSSFDSIRRASKKVIESSNRLDILILNAGIMGCPPKLTAEGYEIQMGTNHVGHAFLLKLLTPLLLKTAESNPSLRPRIVSVASSAWKYAGPERIQFDTLKSIEGVSPVNRYIQSKIVNMLYPRGFSSKYPQLSMVSIDPGEVDTSLFKREPGDEQMVYLQTEVAPKAVRPVEEGVKNHLWAATSGNARAGAHYAPVGVEETTGLAGDDDLAKDVWDWTEKELEGKEL